MRPFAFASALSFVLLAGCSGGPEGGDGDDQPEPFGADSFTVTASDLPAAPLQPGEEFNITVEVGGAREADSDHVGAHFGRETSQAPSTAVYNMACLHQSGYLPGSFTVRCTAPVDSGVYYLRGHARIGATEAEQVSWWSSEHTFTVAGPVQ